MHRRAGSQPDARRGSVQTLRAQRKRRWETLFLNVEQLCVRRIERIATEYSARVRGMRVTRASAARAVINVGLDAIELALKLPPLTENEDEGSAETLRCAPGTE
jgi:hypothetical protein